MEFPRKERYGMEDLVEIVRILRAPGGCPWDREQTHQSIRANFLEETYEAVEAIDTEDPALLKEELGDVLLQILLHAQMEEERGVFCFADVADGIAKKLIERHPHVFGEVLVRDSHEVLQNWDAIKQKTRGQTTKAQALRSVSPALPALMRTKKLQGKAISAGAPLPDSPEQALREVYDSLQALTQAAHEPESAWEKPAGGLLFAAANAVRTLQLEPEHMLSLACDRFLDAFEAWEQAGKPETELPR